MQWWMLALGVGLTVGFVLGALSAKIRNRWCPRCGRSTITYEAAHSRGPHRPPRG